MMIVCREETGGVLTAPASRNRQASALGVKHSADVSDLRSDIIAPGLTVLLLML